ncbi:MAG: hypothetical protein CBC20_08255 [Verrucomicrobia bacterium TMED60]|nr:MAG: hypothetical protein CBC20_08255 [Verrucomicrobia bacterium TMED60]
MSKQFILLTFLFIITLRSFADNLLFDAKDSFTDVLKNISFEEINVAGFSSPTGAIDTLEEYSLSTYEITNRQFASALQYGLENGIISYSSGESLTFNGEKLFDSLPNWGPDVTTIENYGINEIDFNSSTNSFFIDESIADFPVRYVSWYSAYYMAYILNVFNEYESKNQLATWSFDKEATGYSIPSFWQWFRAGSAGSFIYPTGNAIDTSMANFDNVIGNPKKVGSYGPNFFGLYDMAGNVWEWLQDDDESNDGFAFGAGGNWLDGEESMSIVSEPSFSYEKKWFSHRGGIRIAYQNKEFSETSIKAPSSLVGKDFKASWYDSESGEQRSEILYFLSDYEFFLRYEESGSGLYVYSSSFSGYGWDTHNHQGQIFYTIFDESGNPPYTAYVYHLFFSDLNSGTTEIYLGNGKNYSGTFTLNDSPSVNLPDSLVGKIYTESFSQQEDVKVTETLYFKSESELISFYFNENTGSSEIEYSTYTWAKDERNGTLVVTSPSDPAFPEDEPFIGTYSLFFESNSSGFDYYLDQTFYSTSGTFILTESTTGFAPTMLSGQLSMDGTTYLFKENDLVTVRSDAGSSESTYRYIKTGTNSARLETPIADPGVDMTWETSDDTNSTKIELSFASKGEGTTSGDFAGSFSYYPEGTSPPPTKGWMWFDYYPWVYSHEEQGWLYFSQNADKLMVYSVQDKAWREME